MLICNLFQLGLSLLEDFFWLKRFATTMLPPGSPGASGGPEDRGEWEERAGKFKTNVSDIHTVFVKLCSCRNRCGLKIYA